MFVLSKNGICDWFWVFNLMQNLMKDPAIPISLESPQLNLRKVEASVSKNYDEKEIDALVWLLENFPARESMEVSLP